MVLTAVNNTLPASSGALDNEADDVMNVKHNGRRRIVEDDSSEEDETETVPSYSLALEEDDDDDEDSDDAEETPQATHPLPSALPPRPTGSSRIMKDRQPTKSAGAQRRRRRRSSARFLRLTGRFEDQDEDDADEEEEPQNTHQNEHLGEMYKRAIRMNAENRINAGNSWGLRLIENIDQFLVEGGEEEGDRVNFTKASCTLDASVKIYSYRVDDVHLTSYKVLANLNRTETGKKSGARGQTNDDDEDGADEGPEQQNANHRKGSASSERRGATDTLESNLGTCCCTLGLVHDFAFYEFSPSFHTLSIGSQHQHQQA
jgi:condensin complex subunit 2